MEKDAAGTWMCIECGWPWPTWLLGDPPEDAECDNCGGNLTREPAG